MSKMFYTSKYFGSSFYVFESVLGFRNWNNYYKNNHICSKESIVSKFDILIKILYPIQMFWQKVGIPPPPPHFCRAFSLISWTNLRNSFPFFCFKSQEVWMKTAEIRSKVAKVMVKFRYRSGMLFSLSW